NTRKIAGVMLRGRWLPADELHTLQEHIAAIYEGKRSWFDDDGTFAPPVPFHARYRRTDMGVTSGEERIAASRERLIGMTSVDGEANRVYQIELGNGTATSLHLVQDGLDLTLAREGKTAHLFGKTGADRIDRREPIADDESLGGEP